MSPHNWPDASNEEFYEDDEPRVELETAFNAATERGVTARPDDGPDHPFVPAAEDTTRCAYAKSRSDASTFCWRPADEHSRTHLTAAQVQDYIDEVARGGHPTEPLPERGPSWTDPACERELAHLGAVPVAQPATTAVDAVPGTVWKVFTYDADGGYIEELDAPDGHLCVDLTALNERHPDRRVHYLVARETTRPQR